MSFDCAGEMGTVEECEGHRVFRWIITLKHYLHVVIFDRSFLQALVFWHCVTAFCSNNTVYYYLYAFLITSHVCNSLIQFQKYVACTESDRYTNTSIR